MNTAVNPDASDVLSGSECARLHRLIAAAFTPHRTQQVCSALRDVARPYRWSVTCSILGIPCERLRPFARWAEALARPTPDSTFRTALFDVYACVDVMVADRCRNMTDDLLSDLMMAEVDGDELDSDELRMLVADAVMNADGGCLGVHFAQTFSAASEL